MKDNGGPAFPRPHSHEPLNESSEMYPRDAQSGMSLRDWFAGMVLSRYSSENTGQWTVDAVAADCYRQADAMIKERGEEV